MQSLFFLNIVFWKLNLWTLASYIEKSNIWMTRSSISIPQKWKTRLLKILTFIGLGIVEHAILADLQRLLIVECAITVSWNSISKLFSISHCTFINNCVGKRNIKYFFGLLFWGIFGGIYVVLTSIVYCAHYVWTNYEDIENLKFAGPLFLICVPCAVSSFNL